MDIQEIIAFIALGIALSFLTKKFFFKKKKSDKDCGSGDCGCH
jgi:glycopeptide antibiotics resistance protein